MVQVASPYSMAYSPYSIIQWFVVTTERKSYEDRAEPNTCILSKRKKRSYSKSLSATWN